MQKKEGVRFSKITCRNRTGLPRRTFYHFVVIVGKTACSNRFKPRRKYLLLRWDPLPGQECQASSFFACFLLFLFFFLGVTSSITVSRSMILSTGAFSLLVITPLCVSSLVSPTGVWLSVSFSSGVTQWFSIASLSSLFFPPCPFRTFFSTFIDSSST